MHSLPGAFRGVFCWDDQERPREREKGDLMIKNWLRGLAILLCLCCANAGAVDYDEAVDGDLSDDPNMPTLFALEPGSNSLTATSIGGDIEYFYAPVPVGFQLSSIVLDQYSNSFGFSFLANQVGTTFTEPVTGTDPANLLGYYLFSGDDLGMDILEDMGAAFDAQGFTPPLPSGDYTYWSQETGPSITYTYRFEVTPVPEPTGLATCALLVFAATVRCRMEQ